MHVNDVYLKTVAYTGVRYSIYYVISEQPALSCCILKALITQNYDFAVDHTRIHKTLSKREHSDSDPCVEKLTPDSYICLIFLSRRIDFEAVMLLHSNVITRIQIVSKVLSRDLLNTKLKFLVPLSIYNLDSDHFKAVWSRISVLAGKRHANCQQLSSLLVCLTYTCTYE